MLPQIANEVSVETITTNIPSKTYKLNITGNDTPYIIDNKNIVYFKIEDGNLYAIPQNPDCEITFSITDNELEGTSSNEELLEKYSRQGYNVYFETDEYGERIMGYVDNLEAVKQSVYHILMTERYAYLIYSNNYGVELQQYIGADFEYLQATIESTLKEALTYDLRIKDVQVTSIENNRDYALVKFTVYSIYGDLQLEVNISV